jgi:hypothetical protein
VNVAKVGDPYGGIAQLVERYHGMVEARGSSPLTSTLWPLCEALELTGFWLGGLVAGEGSFNSYAIAQRFPNGSPRMRFRFSLQMAERDRRLVESLQAFLSCGSVYYRPARDTRWQPIVSLHVSAAAHHERAVIPFAERYLLKTSAKYRQFVDWRDGLRRHVSERPTQYGRGPSRCSVDQCDGPVRGRGLCRRHYYRVTGY